MATPQMAGVSAIVLQRVQSDPMFALMSARQKADVVQNLIMGTARPLRARPSPSRQVVRQPSAST